VDPHDLINPFKYLASEAGKVIADGWTSAMLGLWNAGLWALRLVLNIIDSLLTPDLSASGAGAAAYRTTFWLAGALVVVMLMIQLGLAVIRRNGKSLAVVLLGLGQFVVVWAG
jgi:type IV secretion system protein TrbL